MLGRLGFGAKWIKWMRSCLESSKVSVLVNGSPITKFNPQKRLRQEDPLALFFLFSYYGRRFVKCSEGNKKKRTVRGT